MSQQINLYDPALLRRREWLTAAGVASSSLVLLAAVVAWGAWARVEAASLEAESQVVAPQLKALQEQLVAVGRQLGEARPNPQLEAELASARALLGLRDEMIAALRKGIGAESPSFAEYMRGLARQSQSGLWLTGFSIGEGGAAIEIRGRMTDAALLPEYIRRLNGEKAFQGHAFGALKVAAAQPAAGQQAPAGPAPWLEFVLAPVADAAAGGNLPANPAPASPAVADRKAPEGRP